jgi:Rod binding domain-containing protein
MVPGLGTKAAGSALPKAGADLKARQTAQDFEAMFLEQTLERMFASVGPEGPLGDNGTGGSVYRSMLVKEYAGSLAKSGGIGIGASVYGEMLRLQEGSHANRL